MSYRSRRNPGAVVLLGVLMSAGVLAAQRPAAPATLAQFRELRWLSGTWRGSGGAYPAFFEEYRMINDSTILMRGYADSTFRAVTDSSWIELRKGIVSTRSDRAPSVATELSADRVRFAREGSARGGFTWSRVSPDQWTATLHPVTPGGAETVYVMRRVRRGSPAQRLGWLAGCWELRQGTRVTLEMWMAPADGLMLGASRTTVNGLVREFEQLRLAWQRDTLIYTALPSGQPEASFKTTLISDDGFMVENPAHDFPQRISYRKQGPDSLVARIEGGNRGIDFPMRRVECGAPAG
jgi:hypothetical protein